MAYGTKTVTSSAGGILIIAANSNRKALKIANTSEGRIVYLAPDSSITTTSGMPLYETQKSEDTWTGLGFWKGDIYGITTTGTADVRYWEIT